MSPVPPPPRQLRTSAKLPFVRFDPNGLRASHGDGHELTEAVVRTVADDWFSR